MNTPNYCFRSLHVTLMIGFPVCESRSKIPNGVKTMAGVNTTLFDTANSVTTKYDRSPKGHHQYSIQQRNGKVKNRLPPRQRLRWNPRHNPPEPLGSNFGRHAACRAIAGWHYSRLEGERITFRHRQPRQHRGPFLKAGTCWDCLREGLARGCWEGARHAAGAGAGGASWMTEGM